MRKKEKLSEKLTIEALSALMENKEPNYEAIGKAVVEEAATGFVAWFEIQLSRTIIRMLSQVTKRSIWDRVLLRK